MLSGGAGNTQDSHEILIKQDWRKKNEINLKGRSIAIISLWMDDTFSSVLAIYIIPSKDVFPFLGFKGGVKDAN